MAQFLVRRRLQRNSAQLRATREELAICDEQWLHISEGEPELEAMDRHRGVLRERISRLETQQDQLLDQLHRGR